MKGKKKRDLRVRVSKKSDYTLKRIGKRLGNYTKKRTLEQILEFIQHDESAFLEWIEK